MKTFVYKTLLIFVFLFVFFQLTIGAKMRQLDYGIKEFKSKKNIESMKNKIREEMRSAISKENYLTPEDAKLINEFINKIKSDLSN